MTCFRGAGRFGLLLAGLGLACAGCGWWPIDAQPTKGTGAENNGLSLGEWVLSDGPEPPPAADEVYEAEANDDFSTAQVVTFYETVRIHGAIAANHPLLDRDVYDLGPANAGDRVLGDLDIGVGQDIALGIFDSQHRLLAYIAPTGSSSSQQIDFVVRETTDRLYVVVSTHSASDEDRYYTTRVSLQRGLGEIDQRPQVLVLNFLGAKQVRVGNRAPVDVPPFNAAAINPNFAGQTQTLINLILEYVRADFAGLGVAIYLAGDPAIPPGAHSTIYYGTYDNRLLGLADNVDPYNSVAAQSAILYTDTFAVFNVLSPTLQQMAQALANTTSHEAGHLLGLRHTADPVDLMDTTATARQMMLDQHFILADLNPTILPLGRQDAPAMLSWTVGGELIAAPDKSNARKRFIQVTNDPNDFYIPRDWLMDCDCTQCGHP